MIDVEIIAHPPKVFLVGKTIPDWNEINDYLAYRNANWNTTPGEASVTETVAEAAGRVCYQSWANKRGATRDEYLRRSIIDHGHGSVLEHVWLNCLVADLPRSVQLELVRHGEGTAFSFESQRFTDAHLRFVAPPLIRGDAAAMKVFTADCHRALLSYQAACDVAMSISSAMSSLDHDATLKRKRVKEAARAVLPNCVGSDGMFSVNARAARHIIQLRSDEHADASIREFAFALYEAVREAIPAVLSDAHVHDTDFGAQRVSFEVSKV